MAYSGRDREALTLNYDLYEKKKRVMGPGNPSTLHTLESLGALETRLGNIAKGTAFHLEHVRVSQSVFGDKHLRTLHAQYLYCASLLNERRFDETEALASALIQGFKDFPEYQGGDRTGSLQMLAESQFELGKYESAYGNYLKLVDLFKDTKPNQHLHVLAESIRVLGFQHKEQGARASIRNTLMPLLEPLDDSQKNAIMARAYRGWDKKKAAMFAIRVIENPEKTNRDTKVILAEILFEGEAFAQAHELLKELHRSSPFESPMWIYKIGRCKEAMGLDGQGELKKSAELALKTLSEKDANRAEILGGE